MKYLGRSATVLPCGSLASISSLSTTASPPPPLAGLQLAQLSAGPQLAGEFGWLDCWLTTPFNPTPKGVPQWEVGPTGDRTGNQKKSKPQNCTKKTESFLFDPEFAMPALSRPIFDPFLADPPPTYSTFCIYFIYILIIYYCFIIYFKNYLLFNLFCFI